jgi:transposase
MSLPNFSGQAERFSTAAASASLFAEDDRYRLFAKVVYPCLVASRATLELCCCTGNGRVAIEPVQMMGVSILQYLDGLPDRQAVDRWHYHLGWIFALNRQPGDARFHPTSLVNFRQRLLAHDQGALAFKAVLGALEQAGLGSRQSRQRLDSTQMFARVSRMSRRRRRVQPGGPVCGMARWTVRPTTAPAARRWCANWSKRAPMPNGCWRG